MCETSYPPGAIIPEIEIIPGEKQCNNCTHYESEHLEGKHCKQVMYIMPMDEDEQKYANAGHTVITARKLCTCKEFVE